MAHLYFPCDRMTEKTFRRQWNGEEMIAAMNAVETNKMALSCAATCLHVPRKTLDDSIKGHVEHGSMPGRNPVLSAVEENALVECLLYMADCGLPLTRTMVKTFVWTLAKRSGNEDTY